MDSNYSSKIRAESYKGSPLSSSVRSHQSATVKTFMVSFLPEVLSLLYLSMLTLFVPIHISTKREKQERLRQREAKILLSYYKADIGKCGLKMSATEGRKWKMAAK